MGGSLNEIMSPQRATRHLFSLLALFAAAAASQQSIGRPFPIHAPASGSQNSPSVAAQPVGSFVVAWAGGDGAGDFRVRIRRFSAAGEVLTPEIPVQAEKEAGISPSTCAYGNGSVVVIWLADGPQGRRLLARHFAPDLTPMGLEQALANPDPDLWRPRVDCLADGTYGVTWRNGADAEEVRVAIFVPPATPVVSERIVNPTSLTHFSNGHQDIALRADGSFTVVWEGRDDDPFDRSVVYHRRFNALGNPVTPEEDISTDPLDIDFGSYEPTVFRDDRDGYRLAWKRSENLDFDRFLTRYMTPGNVLGPAQELPLTLTFQGGFGGSLAVSSS